MNQIKKNYYDILSIFCHLLKYDIENYDNNETIDYKQFRKYFQKNKILYQLTEEIFIIMNMMNLEVIKSFIISWDK